MANSNTDHSRQLRQDTAAARRKSIIASGGRNINVLLDRSDAELFAELQQAFGIRDEPATATDTLRKLLALGKHSLKTGK